MEWLYYEQIGDFERLSFTGLKFCNDLLLMLSKKLVMESDHELFHVLYVNHKDKCGFIIVDKTNYRWITLFIERHNISQRKQTRELMVYAENQLYIEK